MLASQRHCAPLQMSNLVSRKPAIMGEQSEMWRGNMDEVAEPAGHCALVRICYPTGIGDRAMIRGTCLQHRRHRKRRQHIWHPNISDQRHNWTDIMRARAAMLGSSVIASRWCSHPHSA